MSDEEGEAKSDGLHQGVSDEDQAGTLSPTSLVGAIDGGDPLSVVRFLSELSSVECQEHLTEELASEPDADASSRDMMLPIFHAARRGNVDVFLAVYRAMEENLSRNEVVGILTSTRDGAGRTLLVTALRSGAVQIVSALAELLDDCKVATEQRVQMLCALHDKRQTALMIAVQSGDDDLMGAVAKLVAETWVSADGNEAASIASSDSRGWTALTYAVASGRAATVKAVISIIERTVSPEQVNPFIEHSLSFAISEVFGATDASEEARALGVLSCILEHGVWPSPKQLSLIGSSAGFESASKCFLDAICSANNPLLVGMILALQLADAAGMGNEGQRQVASRLQNEVEDLVSEVFERLPQTVDGFQEGDHERGGMEACCIVFAPEKTRWHDLSDQFGPSREEGNRVAMGPLEIALQARHLMELFCTQPLVLDFMARSFTCGLPSLDATEAKLQESGEVQRHRRASLSVQEGGSGSAHKLLEDMSRVLAGPHEAVGSLTLLPGSQFTLAQLVTRPAYCYSVPAVRMGMYLLVYLAMLTLFCTQVLLYTGAVDAAEVIFFIYVLGAILIELMELWDDRAEYVKDHWNLLDVLAFAFCGAAFVVRVSHPESLWGRALYCMGAPLLLLRILFFAQFLPAQGPMIEIIFSLAGELARFGTIMLVAMLGFAISFFSLFRHSCTVDAFRTFPETCINLLRAMLGETQLFDTFTVPVACCDGISDTASDEVHCEDFLFYCCHSVDSEHFNGLIGKTLLVAWLTLMGIILLNLLIAVLSEAYVDVKENIDKEAQVSRTLVIKHYIQAVEEDMLPSPLNLVQYVVSLLAMGAGICLGRKGYFRKAEYFAGLALFWFVSGLFAVTAGSLLWVVSWPKGIAVYFMRRSASQVARTPVLVRAAILTCGVSMPLFLAYNWLWAATCGALWQHLAGAWSRRADAGYSEIGSTKSRHDDGIVGKALKLAPGAAERGNALNVQQLREFLANPMNDPVVQRDEETRETTVEHIKLLRDHVEGAILGRLDRLESTNAARLDSLRDGMEGRVGDIVDDRVGMLLRKVERVDEQLSEILRRLDQPGS